MAVGDSSSAFIDLTNDSDSDHANVDANDNSNSNRYSNNNGGERLDAPVPRVASSTSAAEPWQTPGRASEIPEVSIGAKYTAMPYLPVRQTRNDSMPLNIGGVASLQSHSISSGPYDSYVFHQSPWIIGAHGNNASHGHPIQPPTEAHGVSITSPNLEYASRKSKVAMPERHSADQSSPYGQEHHSQPPRQILGQWNMTAPVTTHTSSDGYALSMDTGYSAREEVPCNTSSASSLARASTLQNTQPPAQPRVHGLVQQDRTKRRKFTNQFNTEQDHYLIFLKEVKQYGWKDITAEFNAEFPYREYHTLQSRYSTNLNKRNRDLDPAALVLPARFSHEATIDWKDVHARNPGPRKREPSSDIQQWTRLASEQASSSGADVPARSRPARGKRVDYTWPKPSGAQAETDEEDTLGPHDIAFESIAYPRADDAVHTNSFRCAEPNLSANEAMLVECSPLRVDFDVEDAQLGLSTRKQTTNTKFPYLSASQRLAVRQPRANWEWNMSDILWQGSILHIDFTESEMDLVEDTIANMFSQKTTRHTTRRRRFRGLLKGIGEPKILRLISKLLNLLHKRRRSSIVSFLQDAALGELSEAPKIYRLAKARPYNRISADYKVSISSAIQSREIGNFSTRGWKSSHKSPTYRMQNHLSDTFGPAYAWTGASSDIHTVAWSPDGEAFAAGAVAVDDPDSMQYNRPNNLMYGHLLDGSIYELAAHTKQRQKTTTGANSTNAMYMSQDPEIYSTVSAVAFSSTGDLLYSAGYDESVCVWRKSSESGQRSLAIKYKLKAQIDLLTVNRRYPGTLATAARISEAKAVRLLTLNEEDPLDFSRFNFQSSKAITRSDLNILPTALQFEPCNGNLLLAGFGANKREGGFDTTGDLCLWDVETRTQLQINPASSNVFDVEFNPNRAHMPLFAVGCVAGANVNRGMHSLLRLYDTNGDNIYRCPIEIECRARDMNDVVWCPYDEHLIAAGCTSGATFVWDLRRHNEPIHTLTHAPSLMPLQEGVSHEVTDTGVRFLSWGNNATRLYTGSSDGVVKVWDVTRSAENAFRKDLVTLNSGIMSGAFSPDMSSLLLGEVNGSVNVLEVGKDDTTIRDAPKLRFMPYQDGPIEEVEFDEIPATNPDLGIAEARRLLDLDEMQLASLGGLPVRQAVQGPSYAGPFDNSVEADFLRQQALQFQRKMASAPGSECTIAGCKDSVMKVTSEEVGDSKRSSDRIPDELRLQWKSIEQNTGVISGKTKCSHCQRPARPPSTKDEVENPALCERCSFACFRCGASNAIAGATTTLKCDTCNGEWEIGALGYECITQPQSSIQSEMNLNQENWNLGEAEETTFGDEMNALTDFYHSLAIDRSVSPSLPAANVGARRGEL